MENDQDTDRSMSSDKLCPGRLVARPVIHGATLAWKIVFPSCLPRVSLYHSFYSCFNHRASLYFPNSSVVYKGKQTIDSENSSVHVCSQCLQGQIRVHEPYGCDLNKLSFSIFFLFKINKIKIFFLPKRTFDFLDCLKKYSVHCSGDAFLCSKGLFSPLKRKSQFKLSKNASLANTQKSL